jgi:UDP-glucose-4-epimerase GalE
VRLIVFSSTCATYGIPTRVPIPEDHAQNPVNPYGASKLTVEWMLRDFDTAYGFRSASLRYFNAAGADPDGDTGEVHHPETHLIPLVLDAAAGHRAGVSIYGDDYDTPDGTCVRDYIHVSDLATAHVAALRHLLRGGDSFAVNLGTGTGWSVRQVIETATRVTGRAVPVTIAARRPGDPPVLVADPSKARRLLGWTPVRAALEVQVADAWNWHRALRPIASRQETSP